MLRALEIKNFTVFEEAKLEFSPGLNVVIGENGTGKSHLLKLGYTLTEIKSIQYYKKSSENTVAISAPQLLWNLLSIFNAELLKNLVSNYANSETCNVKVLFDNEKYDFGFEFNQKDHFILGSNDFFPLNTHENSLYIPTKEIISIYSGFAAALRNRELDFGRTYLDLADALALTPLKGEAAKPAKSIIETLEKQMEGKVVVENGRFYINTGDGRLEMPLVAEGIRKIAMLAYLLMNGSLQKGTTLFWDEPETNLNPKMIRHLAETLVILSSMGIQIVLATHSLFLLRELQIQLSAHPNVPAQFFALKREGKSVTVQQGNSIEDVDPIAALDADLEQSDRYLELT
jgi:AAA15 family ATPase/GTPase